MFMSLWVSLGSVILPRAPPKAPGPKFPAPLPGPTQRALCAAGWQAKCLWNVSAAHWVCVCDGVLSVV